MGGFIAGESSGHPPRDAPPAVSLGVPSPGGSKVTLTTERLGMVVLGVAATVCAHNGVGKAAVKTSSPTKNTARDKWDFCQVMINHSVEGHLLLEYFYLHSFF
jgi:hypothetical protein